MLKRVIIFAITLTLSGGCTLFQKNISKPVTIKFANLFFAAAIYSPGQYAKYVNEYTSQDYTDAFLSTFSSEASSTKNVTYDNNTIAPDFILTVKSIKISETTFTEKINDAKSPNNGQEVTLSSVSCSADVEVYDVKHDKLLRHCYANRNKSEKISNNRDLGDLVTGGNKSHTKYHTKLMRSNIAKDFAGDLGRRIFVHLTKRIAKAIK